MNLHTIFVSVEPSGGAVLPKEELDSAVREAVEAAGYTCGAYHVEGEPDADGQSCGHLDVDERVWDIVSTAGFWEAVGPRATVRCES